MAQRDYSAAIAALNNLQSNFAALQEIQSRGPAATQSVAIPEMIEFCRRIGYEPSDFDRLRPIHIAGTKGKGSTSAFISSILAQYIPAPISKVGLYTSPHLRFVRERIQINNEPISEELFAKYFFDVWDKLSASGDGSKPMYFRYLTLMAMHAFLSEEVSAAVIECGIGGEYDSTNILVSPTTTAITSLGIDHAALLGHTIEEIAWHKSGIFKPGVPAFTSMQLGPAMQVLRKRAQEKGTQLSVVQRHPQIEHDEVELGLAADFQKTNASLAVAVAASHLRAIGHVEVPEPIELHYQSLPPKFITGLKRTRWSGRCEVRQDLKHQIRWHLDGGHTLESIKFVGQWFAQEVARITQLPSVDKAPGGTRRVLIFNQQRKQSDAAGLARELYGTLTQASRNNHPFTHVIFTTNVTCRDGSYKPDLVALSADSADIQALVVQNRLAAVWSDLDPASTVLVTRTIDEAVDAARKVAEDSSAANSPHSDVLILVTGSLHLVGGVLEVLESTGAIQ